MSTNEMAADIMSAPSIADLCMRLNFAMDDLRDSDTRLDEVVDMARLPTWGAPPSATEDVWSYDETHLLRYDRSRGYYTEPRDAE